MKENTQRQEVEEQKYSSIRQLFLAYSFTFLVFGISIGALGPLFPYLAVNQGRSETQYSIIILFRGVGFIVGSIIAAYIQSSINLHQMVIVGLILMGIFTFLFTLINNIYLMSLWALISSFGNSIGNAGINMAALHFFKGDNSTMLLQLLHATYGIGALIAPLAVYVFSTKTLMILGIFTCLISILFFLLRTPLEEKGLKKQDVNPSVLKQQESLSELPNYSFWMLSFCFLISVSEQVGFGNWISSYAVMRKLSTKQHATIYSSIYWISIAVFRGVFALLKGSGICKIRILSLLGVFGTIFGYLIIHHLNPEIGLIFISIMYGMCFSVLFPLLLTVPSEFGFQLGVSEGSLFLMWGSVGEAVIASAIGKLMQLSSDWLLFSQLILNGLMLITGTLIQHLFQEELKLRKDLTKMNLIANQIMLD